MEDFQDEKVRCTLSIPSLVSATKSALKDFKYESNEESSNSIEGTEEAYRGKKFPHARSMLYIPPLVTATTSASKSFEDESNENSPNSAMWVKSFGPPLFL